MNRHGFLTRDLILDYTKLQEAPLCQTIKGSFKSLMLTVADSEKKSWKLGVRCPHIGVSSRKKRDWCKKRHQPDVVSTEK